MQRALPFLELSQEPCREAWRAAAKCTFHCSGVREPELLPQELHSDSVSLKGKEGPYQPTITSSAKTPSEEEFDLADVRKAHSSHEQFLHWWNCLLEQSYAWLFHSRPKQISWQKLFTTNKAVEGKSLEGSRLMKWCTVFESSSVVRPDCDAQLQGW